MRTWGDRTCVIFGRSRAKLLFSLSFVSPFSYYFSIFSSFLCCCVRVCVVVRSFRHIMSVPSPFINTNLYPIHDPTSQEYKKLVFSARESLEKRGCCRLENFISGEGVEGMKRECKVLEEKVRGNQRGRSVNIYYSENNPSHPPSHPINTFFHRNFGVIRDDMIAQEAIVRGVYDDERVVRFACDVVGVKKLYQSRDSYQALTVNVMGEGENLHWHFDCNTHAITLGIQQPEGGGELEYIPNIGRENYTAIEAAMESGEDAPEGSSNYQTKEGALIFFRGGQSIHRVKKVKGQTTRMVAALQLHTADNAVDEPEMTERIYGVKVKDHVGPKKTIVSAEGTGI